MKIRREVYELNEAAEFFLNLIGSEPTSQQTNNKERSINQSDVTKEVKRYDEVTTLYNNKQLCFNLMYFC